MRPWVLLAGLNGAMAVGLAAYAAHGLAGDAVAHALAERASYFQLVHALALLAADRLAADGRRLAHGAAVLFFVGTMLFSGALTVKALTAAPLPVPMVTPVGGIALILGWVVLAFAGLSSRR